ncbi:MAG: DUF3781 domain-containing protein [Bacteroidetes bacterium]|nr:DUF3781 domain-containing protein [Bacteroidota bacterium]
MENYKSAILEKICYTTLVYQRINKKLSLYLSNEEIEKMIYKIILETHESEFQKTGKNIYIKNYEKNIRITVNSFTYRLITVDIMNKTEVGINPKIT